VDGGAAELTKEIQEYYGPLAAKAAPLYAASDGYAPHGDVNAQFATDMQFRCAAVTIAKWHSAARFSTYEYQFSRAPEPRGASHSWELQYVFGNLRQATEAADRKISDQMQTYWTNFAKTGNPNGAGLPNWPAYDGAKQAYLDFTPAGPEAKTALRAKQCAVFQERLSGTMAR
jgi:para-nitrobenzyl esterase